MRKIKHFIRSLSLGSDFDKALLQIQSPDDHRRPSDEIITCKIKNGLEGKEDSIDMNSSKQTPGIRMKNEFFLQLSKEDSWNCSLRLLFTVHKLIHSMMLNFTVDFAKQDLLQSIKASLKISQQRDEIFIPIVLKYYSFLRSVSKHYKEVYECEQYYQTEKTNYLDTKSLGEITTTMRVLINILKNVFRAEQSLSFALQNFPKYEIVKEVALLLIKETIVIFDFLSYLMRRIEYVILSEDTENSLLVYELYEQVVVLSKNMEKMYSLRNLTSDIFLQRPRFFIVDREHNKQIELHVNAIHKRINNTDNVSATVTKSVNESMSQSNKGCYYNDSAPIYEQETRRSRVNSRNNQPAELALIAKQYGKHKSHTCKDLSSQTQENIPLRLQKDNSQQLTSSDTLNYPVSLCQLSQKHINLVEYVDSLKDSSEDELEADVLDNDRVVICQQEDLPK